MILIRSIESQKVDRDTVAVPVGEDFPFRDLSSYTVVSRPETAVETVEGEYFYDGTGKEYCIGMTKEVRDILGIPLDACTNMSNLINDLTAERNMINKQLSSLEEDLMEATDRIDNLTIRGTVKILFHKIKERLHL